MMQRKDITKETLTNEEVIKILDSVIDAINEYLSSEHNRSKIQKNESGRRNNVNALASYVYECLGVNISSKIREILSVDNLSKPVAEKFPRIAEIDKIVNENLQHRFVLGIVNIKNCLKEMQTGWLYTSGNSGLKRKVSSNMVEFDSKSFLGINALNACLSYMDQCTKENIRPVSTFFANTIPQQSYFLFYREASSRLLQNPDQMLSRLNVYFKLPAFLQINRTDGSNFQVRIGGISFRLIIAKTLEQAISALPENGCPCYGFSIPKSLPEIRRLQIEYCDLQFQSKEVIPFKKILGQIGSLDVYAQDRISSRPVKFNEKNGKLELADGRADLSVDASLGGLK